MSVSITTTFNRVLDSRRYDLKFERMHGKLYQEILADSTLLNKLGSTIKGEEIISTKLLLELQETTKKPLRVAIVGRPNAGKSTFINALLERDIVPCHHDPCTAVATEVRIESIWQRTYLISDLLRASWDQRDDRSHVYIWGELQNKAQQVRTGAYWFGKTVQTNSRSPAAPGWKNWSHAKARRKGILVKHFRMLMITSGRVH